MDGDGEEESYSDSDFELDQNSPANNVNQLPLVPTEFTSVQEAMQNFIAVFDSRYGVQHAPFFQGSLQDAIVEAFDSPVGGVEQRRPLAIYLHDDRALAAHIFAQTVMTDPNVSNLLKCQFVLWAWDVTLADNRRSFFTWMDTANLTSVGNIIKIVPSSKYPMLIVLVKERGVISRASCIYGQDTAAMAVQKLVEGLDQYITIKQQDLEQERSRAEREQFRREQMEEYQRGLAADREKQAELKALATDKPKTEHQKMEEKRVQEEADRAGIRKSFLRQKKAEVLAEMDPEPGGTEKDLVRIRISFPSCARIERNFRHSDSLERLFEVVFVHSDCPDNFSLFTNFPVMQLHCAPIWYWNEFYADDQTKKEEPIGTFASAELIKPANVVVRDNDA